MADKKHFNMGAVFGRVVADSIEHKTTSGAGKKPYINFQVNVSGERCGSARAYCRMYSKERIDALERHMEQRPTDPFFFKGFFGQYWDPQNTVYPTYTIFQADPREGDPRATFILTGEVDIVMNVTGGFRILLNLQREGQDAERLELWAQDEKLLDRPESGNMINAKGYLRQEHPIDDFGGSSGPVRSYVEELKIL